MNRVDTAPEPKDLTQKIADTATTKTPSQEFLIESFKEEIVPLTSLGEKIKVISDNQVILTKELAESFLHMQNFAAERAMSEPWAQVLLHQMCQNTFRYEQVTLISAIYNGVEYRMNGQHTSWAIWKWYQNEMAKGVKKPTVRWLRYRCETEEDLRHLYATTDRGRPRSRSHQIQAYIYDSPEFKGLSKGALSLVSQSLGPWLGGFTPADVIPTDRLVYMMKTKHYNLSKIVAIFLDDSKTSGTKNKHITRAPVCAAMMATFSINQSESQEFWKKVRDAANLEAKDPALKLAHYLMQHGVNAGRGASNKGLNTVTGEDMYRTCICHWNAWRISKRTGRNPQLVKVFKDGVRPKAK